MQNGVEPFGLFLARKKWGQINITGDAKLSVMLI
jgi:hypothetical protein